MASTDFLVLGGGVAGLSIAARLADHGKVVVLEAEEALGYHSSGRSATFSHYGIGNAPVRALTACSRSFFLGAEGPPLCNRSTALFVATEEMLPDLAALEARMTPFTSALERIGPDESRRLFPPLRTGRDSIVAAIAFTDGLRLDPDALLQTYARSIRKAGGIVRTGARIVSIRNSGPTWTVKNASGESWSAPLLVNAAGAWADEVALLAGVAPLGLRPLRRTIILVDPPAGSVIDDWPFVKTVIDDFYILPQSGRLMASPVDEVESGPCDAQPEDLDLAVAAAKVEQYTTLKVERIAHRWAGLRTFASDRVPVIGFAPDRPNFFWLAGQGGFGLQTAPAVAMAAEALITGSDWPVALRSFGVEPGQVKPDRLLKD